MKYRDCMIGYNRGGPMEVGPHPDKVGWSDKYRYTVGSAFLKVKKASQAENDIQMLLEFHHAVVRDKVPVDVAHAAFCQIDDYRELMAEDVRIP